MSSQAGSTSPAVRPVSAFPGFICRVLGITIVVGLPLPAAGQTCFNCGFILPLKVCPIPATIETEEPVCSGIINCVQPTMSGPFVQAVDQGNGSFAIRLAVDIRTPFNSHPQAFSNGKLDIGWWQGNPTMFGDICENNGTDRTLSYVQLGTGDVRAFLALSAPTEDQQAPSGTLTAQASGRRTGDGHYGARQLTGALELLHHLAVR